jgi:cob(I)alamin adenosyltransferase
VYSDRLEQACDHYNEQLDPLRSFVLPGGTMVAAQLHVARTIVRRAERSTWAALGEYGRVMSPLTAMYLNRLSDLLFILSRVANVAETGGDGDRLWKPGGER